jgi:probable HAF family extracellular repeat protein
VLGTAGILLPLTPPRLQGPFLYRATNLGTLGGLASNPSAINNHGEVVGSAMTASNQIQAFRTKPNQLINPDTDDPGMNPDGTSWAFDVPPTGLMGVGPNPPLPHEGLVAPRSDDHNGANVGFLFIRPEEPIDEPWWVHRCRARARDGDLGGRRGSG